MRNAVTYGTLAAALTASGPAFAGGCAMCRTAVTDTSDPFASGLNAGILFLLALPFVLTSTVGGIVWWARRPHPLLKAAV